MRLTVRHAGSVPLWFTILLVVGVGYFLGSVPVAALVARRSGVADLRAVGDRNPGYWNARERIGVRAAAPIFAGDVAKGAMAAGFGALMAPDGQWWLGYVGGGAAMVGHAWPALAGWRGGRSVLTFVGTACVVAPIPAAIAWLVVLITWRRWHSLARAARIGLIAFPLVQVATEGLHRTAATGALMTFIGFRFASATMLDRRSRRPCLPSIPPSTHRQIDARRSRVRSWRGRSIGARVRLRGTVMYRLRRHSTRTIVTIGAAIALVTSVAGPAGAKPSSGFLTGEGAYITIADGLPSGSYAKPIISSGETIGDFRFEGLPDGIGIRPGTTKHTVDVYVAHEQTTVPFFGTRDFENASISKLTLQTKAGNRQGSVLDASVALPGTDEFLRFCSANMAGPDDGLDGYVFITGEETSDVVDGVQRGYAVVLDTDTGDYTAVPGLGRLNHENTVIVPGGWDGLSMLTTDDTFTAATSQLYMYQADDQDALFADEGSLSAFRVTGVDGVPVDATNAFNGANDYLDLAVGESFQGEFIAVPRAIAIGDQTALENWSNDNNVMQFVRLEDVAVDQNDPRTVYIADTGASRVVSDPVTGRMWRPAGTGLADNGRIFKMIMNADDPTVVDSLTILADGDAVGTDVYVPFTSPDNLDTSKKSLMVQEDTDDAAIWQHHLRAGWWRQVATVNDPDGESSGIVDASPWFGGGTWLLDVQGHGRNVAEEMDGTVLVKRESGQLLLMKIPGS